MSLYNKIYSIARREIKAYREEAYHGIAECAEDYITVKGLKPTIANIKKAIRECIEFPEEDYDDITGYEFEGWDYEEG